MKTVCTFRLSEEARQRLIELADKNGVTRNAIVELMIREYTTVATIVHKKTELQGSVK